MPGEKIDDRNHQPDGEEQRELHVGDRVLDRGGCVVHDVDIDRGRQLLAKRWQFCPDCVHHVDGVGVRLALHGEHDGLFAIEPAAGIGIIDTVGHIGDIAEMNGRTVIRGHDQRPEGRRIGALGIGLDRQALIVVLQGADRHLVIRLCDGVCDGIDAKPPCLKLCRIEADAHGIGLCAVDAHLRDAGDGRQKRRDDILGDFIHLAGRHFLAVDGKQQDRRIGGVGLAVARRRRHVAWQLPLRTGNSGLHIGGRRIDIAVEIELQNDRAVAERVGGADFADARNGLELLDQRRGDGGCHCLRRCARQRRRDADRRKIDFRQGGDRQQAEAGKPRQHEAYGKKGGGDGPVDAEIRDHGVPTFSGVTLAARLPAAPPLSENCSTTC